MRRKQFSWQLPEEIENRLGDSSYGRQRAIFEKDNLLVILHMPPEADDWERKSQIFLRKPDGTWWCNGEENGVAQLNNLMGVYTKFFQECDTLYESTDDAKSLFELLEILAPINRATTNLYNALQSAREKISDDGFLLNMRDEAYELSRNFDLLLGDSKFALDYRIAKNAEAQTVQAEAMANAQHKLNILAALTFPLMALAAVLGMNLVHGFENMHPVVFWGVGVSGFFVGLLTKFWVTKK